MIIIMDRGKLKFHLSNSTVNSKGELLYGVTVYACQMKGTKTNDSLSILESQPHKRPLQLTTHPGKGRSNEEDCVAVLTLRK